MTSSVASHAVSGVQPPRRRDTGTGFAAAKPVNRTRQATPAITAEGETR